MKNTRWIKSATIIISSILICIMIIAGCVKTPEENTIDAVADDSVDSSNVSDNLTEDASESVEEKSYPVVDSVTIVEADYMSYNAIEYEVAYTPIKGIYLSGYTAGTETSRDSMIEFADTTEINAFVIDVKNDDGFILFDTDIAVADEIGSERGHMRDITAVMDDLYAHDIYPIARIVAFKDPYLSSKLTDYAIKNQDGSLFKYHGVSWMNPYSMDAWIYIVDIAKAAAEAGFKEVQFDYIRFEATSSLNNADFGDIDPDVTRKDIIVSFLEYASTELAPYDIKISADVFGTIITSEVDARTIGQDYYRMSEYLDVICPMVYPSHYAKGSYGTAYPDKEPYTIIYGSMTDSNEVLGDLVTNEDIIVRPWLQAFTASYLKTPNYMVYDGDAIRAQIQATYDAGLEEWILWKASNTYSTGGLLGPEE
ncbi:MAG: putative glycoside hydrolase [Vallitaleaceae bacterium]|jgi:hypothetical protein|nr:putative glycoside hydrolase [Vallitaleaceae bacterium]